MQNAHAGARPTPHAQPLRQVALEEHGYLPGLAADDGLIYYVHHRACCTRLRGPGAVLLVGAMGLERAHSHLVWVRWARHLARRGLDVLRFDYRGLGESTGEHAELTLDSCVEDVTRAVGLLRALHPSSPIALHGLRGGALCAARVFAAQSGQSLLLWEPPPSARAMLLEKLRHKLAADFGQGTREARRTRQDYIADLEAGERVDVEGYPWSRGLWLSTADSPLVLPGADEPRRSLVVHLDGRSREGRASVDVPRPPFWGESRWLHPELSALFDVSCRFLESA
ncbi:MAG TPA: alpha/beta hydrolase [Polyangiaceae bacterium]|nr:alpha/beta hydrolase [Polyangiaceae bacterium]